MEEIMKEAIRQDESPKFGVDLRIGKGGKTEDLIVFRYISDLEDGLHGRRLCRGGHLRCCGTTLQFWEEIRMEINFILQKNHAAFYRVYHHDRVGDLRSGFLTSQEEAVWKQIKS